MQPTPPQPPAPPAPPAVPAAPAAPAIAGQPVAAPAADQTPTFTSVGTRPLPRTAQDVIGLRSQRDEMTRQLAAAQSRRRDVARDLERADNPANRAGLEQRLGVLDQRIAQLENDVAETGRLITTASPALVAQAERPEPGYGSHRGPPASGVAIVFILFVLFPLVLAFGRGVRRRGLVVRPDPVDRESAARLARVEQAVDAIAVEIERVSEGQRFVTRLLAESRGVPPAVGAPAAEPPDTLDAVSRYAG